MTMMGTTMAGNAQTITSLGGVLPTPASPSANQSGEVSDFTTVVYFFILLVGIALMKDGGGGPVGITLNSTGMLL